MFDQPVDLEETYGVKKLAKRKRPPLDGKPKRRRRRNTEKLKKAQKKYAVEAAYQASLGKWYRENF